MSSRKILLLTVVPSLLLLPPLHAQDAVVPRAGTFPGIEDPAFPYSRPEEVGLSSDKLDRLGDEVTAWVANGDLVGAELLIVKDGRAVFHEAYGWADREERRPMRRNSIFSIKSMSKPFTAMAILMLEEEGKLSLDDPVSRYIPTFKGDERTRIRHLLAHTTGYGGLGDTRHFDSLEEWVEDWASQAPTGAFGEYRYSDFNYAALGRIVEAVSGMPADAFLRERIIEPLGLTETYTTFSPDSSWAERVNSRYRWNDEAADYERYWTHRGGQGWPFYPAAWGIWATAMDYARFMTAWLNKGHYEGVRLLAEENVEEALQPHALTDGYSIYGFGWFIETDRGAEGMPLVFQHGGFDGTIAMAFPADHSLVIFLTHSRGRGHRFALAQRLAMLGLLEYPGPGRVWADEDDVAEVELSPEERARYIGTYRGKDLTLEDGPALLGRVWEEGDRLHMDVGEAGELSVWRSDLVPLGEHRFVRGLYRGGKLAAIDPRGTVRFTVRNGDASAFEYTAGNEVEFSAHRADSAEVRAEIEAKRSRVSLADIIRETLEERGIAAARARHRTLLASRPDSVHFGESLLNTLGYRLLSENRVEEAVAIFEMNAEAYPEAPNPYDSLGDAYAEAGRLEDARRSYERAVELAEQQGHGSLETYRENLERVTRQMNEQ